METRFEILASSKEEDVEDDVAGLELMARRRNVAGGKEKKCCRDKKKPMGTEPYVALIP